MCVNFVPILRQVDLVDSEFVFDRLPNYQNRSFGRFERTVRLTE